MMTVKSLLYKWLAKKQKQIAYEKEHLDLMRTTKTFFSHYDDKDMLIDELHILFIAIKYKMKIMRKISIMARILTLLLMLRLKSA
jgi:hypothetical protein